MGGGEARQLGARVEVIRKTGGPLWRRARSDGSYASANDPRVLVGLGASTDPVRLRVSWPSGKSEEFGEVPDRSLDHADRGHRHSSPLGAGE